MKLKRIFAPLAIATGLLSQPTFAQDYSVGITYNAYYSLQNYAQSDTYQTFQRSLVKNGYKYNETRQQARVFMDGIASGRFDGNFRAMVNLSVCASFALINLAKEFNLPQPHPLFKKAFQAHDRMSDAIGNGYKMRQVDCREVFYTYGLK